jgi:hypothetical protein
MTASDLTEGLAPITCDVCGKDITADWKGRGRKPKFCDAHRTEVKKPVESTIPKGSSGDVKTALATMEQFYGFVSAGLFLAGMHDIMEDFEEALPTLQEKNKQFLENDKELVKKLSTIGKTSGRTGFFIANAMVLLPTGVAASRVIRERGEAKALAAQMAAEETPDND